MNKNQSSKEKSTSSALILLSPILINLLTYIVNPNLPPTYSFGTQDVIYIIFNILLQSLYLLYFYCHYTYGYSLNLPLRISLYFILPLYTGLLLIMYNIHFYDNLGSDICYLTSLFWFVMIIIGVLLERRKKK